MYGLTPSNPAARLRAQIAEAEALAAKATPGPWQRCSANDGNCSCGIVWDGAGYAAVMYGNSIENFPYRDGPSREQMNANLDLAAASRTLVPQLAAALRVCLGALEQIERADDPDTAIGTAYTALVRAAEMGDGDGMA